jgi:hypothetical protein
VADRGAEQAAGEDDAGGVPSVRRPRSGPNVATMPEDIKRQKGKPSEIASTSPGRSLTRRPRTGGEALTGGGKAGANVRFQ